MAGEDAALGAIGGAAQLGIGAATGNPLAILGGITSLIGVGSSILGTSKSTQAAGQIAQYSAQNAQFELQKNEQRRKAMELSARRQQMEITRTQQRARALALAGATSGGAQFGSGLMGGYGQIAGQTGVNSLGVSQNLEIGRNIFGLDTNISQNKIKIAQAGGDAATGAGYSALGGSLVNASGSIGRLAGLGQGTPSPNINPGVIGGGYLGTGGQIYEGPGQYGQ